MVDVPSRAILDYLGRIRLVILIPIDTDCVEELLQYHPLDPVAEFGRSLVESCRIIIEREGVLLGAFFVGGDERITTLIILRLLYRRHLRTTPNIMRDQHSTPRRTIATIKRLPQRVLPLPLTQNFEKVARIYRIVAGLTHSGRLLFSLELGEF